MSVLSRVAAIDSSKLLRIIANVCFGEAAPQRRALQRTAAMGRKQQPSQRAETGSSLRVRGLSTIKEEADLQHKTHVRGAANGRKEPSLPNFCDAAKVGYRLAVENLQQPPRF